MEDERIATQELLSRWHQGDEQALGRLLARHLPWIERQVSARLGARLRAKAETQDFVQDALLEALRYTPRFTLESGGTFRRLMLLIIRNILCDRADWFDARRREMHRERPLVRDTVLQLDPPVEQVEAPDAPLEAREEEARVRLALELLDADERQLILRREWDRWGFARIGAELSVSEDAARMRFHRALIRMQERVVQLSQGRLDDFLPGENGNPDD